MVGAIVVMLLALPFGLMVVPFVLESLPGDIVATGTTPVDGTEVELELVPLGAAVPTATTPVDGTAVEFALDPLGAEVCAAARVENKKRAEKTSFMVESYFASKL